MRKFEDMEIIMKKETYREARDLVKQLKENPQSTCCVVIAGYRAKKSKYLYEELYTELILFRDGYMFKKKDYPWIVGWKHGCGHLWKDNT